jgi:hypothetical protein
VGGEGFAIDASLVKADANRQRGVPGDQADWSDRPSISRPAREYLAALDQSELEKSTPKNISLTDPAAQWSAAWGPAFYAYSANYLIDIAAGIVVDVEATPAHKTDEINATKTMIERVEDRFDLKPDRLIGDTNYGTAEILGWMVDEKQIEPHVSVCDKTQHNDETLASSDFQWNEQADEYRCPQGHVLRSQWRPTRNSKHGDLNWRRTDSPTQKERPQSPILFPRVHSRQYRLGQTSSYSTA